jgi:hypothetical protein
MCKMTLFSVALLPVLYLPMVAPVAAETTCSGNLAYCQNGVASRGGARHSVQGRIRPMHENWRLANLRTVWTQGRGRRSKIMNLPRARARGVRFCAGRYLDGRRRTGVLQPVDGVIWDSPEQGGRRITNRGESHEELCTYCSSSNCWFGDACGNGGSIATVSASAIV